MHTAYGSIHCAETQSGACPRCREPNDRRRRPAVRPAAASSSTNFSARLSQLGSGACRRRSWSCSTCPAGSAGEKMMRATDDSRPDRRDQAFRRALAHARRQDHGPVPDALRGPTNAKALERAARALRQVDHGRIWTVSSPEGCILCCTPTRIGRRRNVVHPPARKVHPWRRRGREAGISNSGSPA